MNHERTWQFDVNQTIGTTTAAPLLFAIKDSLVSFASSPWVVTRSSNASVANTSDNWATSGDLTWGTGNHSWIVLYQAATGIYFLLDLNNASSNNLTATISYNPFTGGTISAAPTATNSQTIISGSVWGYFNSPSSTFTLSVMHSEDGYGTRSIIWRDVNNVYTQFWAFDYLEGASILYPSTTMLLSTGTSEAITAAELTTSANYYAYDNVNSQWMNLQSTFEGYSTDTVNANISNYNEIDGYFQVSRMGLFSRTRNARGKHGYLKDHFTVSSTFLPHGTTFDSDRWLCLANVLIPWNQSTPVKP